ncbi:MAG: AzlD domain-containing protein [Eubacterium sp.]|nr:AzlD domain-containing protein [Eubacterium sp.]
MSMRVFLPYLLIMAVVTHLIRTIPLLMIRKKISNRFFQSFLYYVPYTVLSAMTFPSILYATGSMATAAAGLVAALILAFNRRSLIEVALGACAAVLIASLIL